MERAISFSCSPEEFFDQLKHAVREVILENQANPRQTNSPPFFDQDEILTSKEVCAMLDISAPSLIKYRRLGLIKGKLVGGKYYYLKEDIKKTIQKK